MTTEAPNQKINGSKPRPFCQRLFHQTKPNINEKDFSVVTYNTLADAPLLSSPKEYEFCEERFKKRVAGSHRHELFLEELKWLDSDVLCLQEVDKPYFDNVLHESLSKLGYTGHYVGTHVFSLCSMGIAAFFKTEVFELVVKKDVSVSDKMQEACRESNQEALLDHLEIPTKILMLALRHKASNRLVIIANIHVRFDWYGYPVRQLLEICCASKILQEFKESLEATYKGLNIPYIFCGDFNIEPSFPAYKVLSCGALDKEDLTTLQTTDYIRYYKGPCIPAPETNKISDKENAILCHLNKYFVNGLKTIKSTYKTVLGKEPDVTNHVGGVDHWVLDYLWYSPDSLCPTGVLDVVAFSSVDSGIPNEFFPSDHLSLKACYSFVN